MADVVVTDNSQARFYEATVDGVPAGALVYELVGDRIVLTHTEVKEEFQGQGIAGQLVRGALDDLRSRGRVITSRCPVVSGFIAKHPDYEDLLDPAHP
jgi:predicted GNAT family acetyltransferase